MQTVHVGLALAVAFLGVQRPKYLVEEIQQSTEVARLEKLAVDIEFSDREYDARKDPFGGPKIARAAAYVRLGKLGTSQSLAAIKRIESQLRNRSILPPVVRRGGWLPNPVSHVGDSHWWAIAETVATDGYNYSLMSHHFYGQWSLFVCRFDRKADQWSRPWLVPLEVDPWTRIRIRMLGPGRMALTFSATSETELRPPPPQTIDLANLTIDTDGDGWTDVEESHLGLNPRRSDSDDDGIRDDHDAMPLFAAPRGLQPSEDDRILQRAIFASFGLTGAPHALFVDSGSKQLHVESNAGPFLYVRPTTRLGIRVSWRILEKQGGRATVEIADYEGPLSASTNYVSLERKGSEWFVVEVAMGAIS